MAITTRQQHVQGCNEALQQITGGLFVGCAATADLRDGLQRKLDARETP